MTSRIPDTRQTRRGGNNRRAFWLGVLSAIGLIFGAYFVFAVSINWGDGIVVESMQTTCDQQQLTVTTDRDYWLVGPGEAMVSTIADMKVEWRCGDSDYSHAMTCRDGTQYLIVLRYPESDDVSVKCDVGPFRRY